MAIYGGRATQRAARRSAHHSRRGAIGHLGQYGVVVSSLDLIIVNRVDDSLTRRSVDKKQISRLVEMVVGVAP